MTRKLKYKFIQFTHDNITYMKFFHQQQICFK